MRGQHYNWPAIKAMYVEGVEHEGTLTWPTLDECAREHNARPDKVRLRAAGEGWTDQRVTFQRRIEEQRQAERSEEVARLGADLDVAALRVSRGGMSLVAARLAELQGQAAARGRALQKAAEQERAGNEEAAAAAALDAPPAPQSEELRRLAAAAGDWYALGARALGDTATTRVLLEPPTRPIQVSHEHHGEVRDARIKETLAVLVEIGAWDGITGIDGITGEQPPAGLAELLAGAAEGTAGPDADTEADQVHSERADTEAEGFPAP